MAKSDRAVRVPGFGRLLVQARGHRQPNSVVAKLHGLSPAMHGFSRPQLDRYEAGQTHRPDPVALFFLARLYGADLSTWLEALAIERERQERERQAVDEDGPATLDTGPPSDLDPDAGRTKRAGSR